MAETPKPVQKLTFSGHDTFHCRHLWLKKGYDFINSGNKFSQDDAVVILGVGKNMVSAINFWMRAFGIIDKEGLLTEFAKYLLDDKGKDPYIEDEATLRLLHYQLVTLNISSSYNLIFNELRREKIEFTKDNFRIFILRKGNELKISNLNSNTIDTDFEVMSKMYIRTDAHSKDKEDTFSGLLTELDVIQVEKREYNKKMETFYAILNNERSEIPDEILFYAMLDFGRFDKSISLSSVEYEDNNIGRVFAINRTGLVNRFESFASNPKFKKYGVVYNDNGGVKELQFKTIPKKFEILNNYYGN